MIFRSLELEDFGIYAGRQRIDLMTRRGRPVVLVGGTNGAGKTTLLEAFTLCLHGRRALGPRIAQETYAAHIRSRFHVVPDGDAAEECAITLAFEHVQSGRSSEYVVSRRWKGSGSGPIKETLALILDGEVIHDLSSISRQDFLDSLLPPGLAGFFLFDGEQIQALADDQNGEYLADAVRRLLGLDLIDQLQVDLRRFVGKATSKEDDELFKSVEVAEREVVDAKEEVSLAKETSAMLQAEQDQLDGQLGRARDRLGREGGTLAAERAKLEGDARKAAGEVTAATEQLKGLIAGLLPFSITQQLAAGVAERLEAEQVLEENEIVARRIRAASIDLKEELQTKTGKPVAATIRRLLGAAQGSQVGRLHDVSASERAIMLDQLRLVRDDVPAEALRVGKRLKRAQDKNEQAARLLDEVPDSEALAPLVESLQEIEHQRGELSSERERLDEELRQAEHILTSAERKLRRAQEESESASKGIESARVALRTVDLLRDYRERTELRRLERIELEAARYFNRLSRKGELLSGITIDRDSFHVRVIRWDQTELPKERLSAGEKQLLAIAILWALAKASQRPLPVVVDTPLARLDREHRRRLLTEYLPNVSHQVIVLSTDTEVDVAAAAELEAVTARRVFLSHDLGTAATAVEEGYFSSAEEVVSGAR